MRKILRKYSKNFWAFAILATHFHNYVTSGSSNRKTTLKLSQLTREWISYSRKRLRQNFQNFVNGFLSTCFGNLLVGHLSRKNHVFCTNRVKSQIVFKNFSIFPSIMQTHFVFFTSPSPKSSIFTHKTFIFFINLQE